MSAKSPVFSLRNVGLAIVLLCVALVVHRPLPVGVCDRGVLQPFEVILRVLYFHPLRLMGNLFGDHSRMGYARATLHSLVKIFNPWTPRDRHLHISDADFGGVPVRLYEPVDREGDAAFVFIHGGGFVLFNADSFETPVRAIAKRSRVLTISIDYRLAPEHAFPAGLNDVERAVRHFLAHAGEYGVDPSKVIVGGDSAGGNLATVLSRHLRDDPSVPSLRAQVLIYPFLQFVDMQTPSYQLYHAEYPETALLDPESVARYLLMYVGLASEHAEHVVNNGHVSPAVMSAMATDLSHESLPERFTRHPSYSAPSNRSFAGHTTALPGTRMAMEQLQHVVANPDFSPLLASDLSDLPRTLIVTCGFDILRDDGFWYAERLRASGVHVDHSHYDDAFHGMINFYNDISVAQRAVHNVADYVRLEATA